jgi:hypothetical protein
VEEDGQLLTAFAVLCMCVLCCGVGSGGTPVAAFDPRRRLLQAAADDTIKRCPDGTWTQNVGASTVEQCCECACLTPLHVHAAAAGSLLS